jgi:hypothetical protein
MTNRILSNSIGARNPFVIAELKLRKSINWNDKKASEKMRILEQAFGRPYRELFDPRFGSSVFPAFRQKKFQRIETGDSIPCSPNPCPVVPSSNWIPVPNGKFTPDAIAYNDLVQGCLPDCYLIAAVSAMAWATGSQSRFRNDLNSSPYTYQFWSPQVNSQGQPILNLPPVKDPTVTVNDTIPMILPDQKIYSRSNTPTETWPCIYEKAYATWKYCKLNNIPPSPSIQPDYLKICQGNPLVALMSMSGTMPVAYYTSDFLKKDATGKPVLDSAGNPTWDGARIYTTIGTQSSAPSITLQTYYPTVAWTYNPMDPSNLPPAGVTYRDDVIVANHSYTVLGVHPKTPVAGKNYIVLRNPWGQKFGDPHRGIDPNLGTDPFSDDAWLPLGFGKKFSDPADGIFALNADTFGKYFAGFGWIKWP